jgi:hypothetical protein
MLLDMAYLPRRAVLEKYIVTVNKNEVDDGHIIITDSNTLETYAKIHTVGYKSYVFTYSRNSFIVTTFVPGLSYKYIGVYLYTITDDGIIMDEIEHNNDIEFAGKHTDDGIIAFVNGTIGYIKYVIIKLDTNFKEVVVRECDDTELKYILYTKYGPLHVSNSKDKIHLKLGESMMELSSGDDDDIYVIHPDVRLIGDDHICLLFHSHSCTFYSIKDGCFDIMSKVKITLPIYMVIRDILYYESTTNILVSTGYIDTILRFSISHTDDLLSLHEVAKDKSQFIAARDGKVYVHTREGNVKVI